MENDKLTLGKILFEYYLFLSISVGTIITIMNFKMSDSLADDFDPNPHLAMYFVVVFPMIIGLVISIIVSIYQYVKHFSAFKKSLIPLIIWTISFIALFF